MRKWGPILAFIMIMLCSFPVFAHSGRTDSNGGHHDGNDYHYHHGYPAHDHRDMDGDGDLDCTYDFDDKANSNSGKTTSNSEKSSNSEENSSSRFWDYVIAFLPIAVILLAVYWPKIKSRISKLKN